MVEQRGSVIGRIHHGIERRLQEWRRQDAARKTCAEVDRDELWAEAVERGKLLKLLAEAVGEEQARRASLGEVLQSSDPSFCTPRRLPKRWEPSPARNTAS